MNRSLGVPCIADVARGHGNAAITAMCCLGHTRCGAGGAAGLPPGAIRFEKAMIVDATGFESPMAATTLFLPAGWRTQGGVFWGQEFMCTNGYNFNWIASAPDGLHEHRGVAAGQMGDEQLRRGPVDARLPGGAVHERAAVSRERRAALEARRARARLSSARGPHARARAAELGDADADGRSAHLGRGRRGAVRVQRRRQRHARLVGGGGRVLAVAHECGQRVAADGRAHGIHAARPTA